MICSFRIDQSQINGAQFKAKASKLSIMYLSLRRNDTSANNTPKAERNSPTQKSKKMTKMFTFTSRSKDVTTNVALASSVISDMTLQIGLFLAGDMMMPSVRCENLMD
jgi:hypothetical protein